MMKYLKGFAFDLLLFLALVAMQLLVPSTALAEVNADMEGYSWSLLATVAGASAFTLLVVQYLKAPLDKIWKIPTRTLAYIVSFICLAGSNIILEGFNPEIIMYAAVNAVIAGSTAIGAYEVTFKKSDDAKNDSEK